jgi:hypothetical protein
LYNGTAPYPDERILKLSDSFEKAVTLGLPEKEGGALCPLVGVRSMRYCRENGILKEFLEKNGTEVMNMLLTEWNMDDALEVRFEEGMEEGREEVARNALASGLSPELVCTITGLDLETINSLGARC